MPQTTSSKYILTPPDLSITKTPSIQGQLLVTTCIIHDVFLAKCKLFKNSNFSIYLTVLGFPDGFSPYLAFFFFKKNQLRLAGHCHLVFNREGGIGQDSLFFSYSFMEGASNN